jgi:hypothetical protein
VSGQLYASAALPPGKEPLYRLDRRLFGVQSRSVRGEEEKNPVTVPAGNGTPVVQSVAKSLY